METAFSQSEKSQQGTFNRTNLEWKPDLKCQLHTQDKDF